MLGVVGVSHSPSAGPTSVGEPKPQILPAAARPGSRRSWLEFWLLYTDLFSLRSCVFQYDGILWKALVLQANVVHQSWSESLFPVLVRMPELLLPPISVMKLALVFRPWRMMSPPENTLISLSKTCIPLTSW